MTLHSDECKRHAAQQAAWHQRWPKACHDCGASGWREVAVSYDEPPEIDICPSCLGRCPRCATEINNSIRLGDIVMVTNAALRCPECGWDDEVAGPFATARPADPFDVESMEAPVWVCACGPVTGR
jgi:hypothetical protein